MNGAHEFSALFGEGEFTHGKLLLVSGCHARGNYFHVYISNPDGTKTEVYGILGGHPGWTECYGWLHHGKWQEDFAAVCEEQKNAVERQQIKLKVEKESKERAEQQSIADNLARY